MFGPTRTLRNCFCAMTSLRSRLRSAAYCSRLIRSRRANFCILQAVGHSEQRHGMRRRAPVSQAAFYLVARHRTVARIIIRAARGNALNDRPADLHGGVAKLSFDAIGAVVPRTALDRLDRRLRNELEDVAGLEAHVLH